MNEFLFVLVGGAISLVSSATVTWFQGRQLHRRENRATARESVRQLTGLLIAERDTPSTTDSTMGSSPLAEAEMLSMTITERRTRERLRQLIRLLGECRLPELEQLSGVKSAQARQVVCEHALEVLGANFRNDRRLPAIPKTVQKLLDTEEEALSVRAGSAPQPGRVATEWLGIEDSDDADTSFSAAESEGTQPASRKVRRSPRTTQRTKSKTEGKDNGDAATDSSPESAAT
ncbi:hypothetical protein [Salinactinospora qingdaonensis]